MNRRFSMMIGAGILTTAVAVSGSFAQEQSKPPMHMHKYEMDHTRPDKEVSKEYKSEATQLHEKAASHRKLASNYRARGPGKSGGDISLIARHCDKLADSYEEAAKAADAMAAELAK